MDISIGIWLYYNENKKKLKQFWLQLDKILEFILE